MFQTLRWPRGDRRRGGGGILLVRCYELPHLTPAGKRPKVHHASIRPARFHRSQFLAGIDEFCQDFMWFSPNRLYPV